MRRFRFIHNKSVSISTSSVPQSEVSLLAPQHTEAERRAFHYFTHYAAPMCAGVLDARFFEDLLPRLAQTYDFVWDTVACISFLIEHVPYMSLAPTFDSTGLTKVTNREHRQALRLYNRAIVNVRQLAERDQIDDSVIALSYILFASVEFQQRSVKTGTDLLKKCCMILTDNLTSLYTRQNTIASQSIHQVVAPLVLRKGSLIATLGNVPPPECAADTEVSSILEAVQSKFPTPSEARVQLDRLMYRCYEVIRHADFIPIVKDDDPGKKLYLSQRQSLLESLVQWKASFIPVGNPTPDVDATWLTSYLLMSWAVCYISLAACVSPRQTTFDNYMDHFADIVKYATICLEHGDQATSNRPLSSSDPGLVPPLYFCAIKCRDPILRRKALCLIRRAPPQESPWAYVAPARVIARFIAAEEGEHQRSLPKDSLESPHVGLPPEEHRYAYVSVMGRRAPDGKQRLALELCRFDCASDGSRKVLNDYLWLDDGEKPRPDA